jgi:hypothetical protein
MFRAPTYSRLLAIILQTVGIFIVSSAYSDVRVALVIGNARYSNAPALGNPANDASDVSAALTHLGFKTNLLVDGSKREMDRAVEQFARDARGANIVLFFFAGHGMQFQQHNYILPVDAELKDEISVRYELTAIDDITSALQDSRAVKVLLLDSCRDNPLADKLARSAHLALRDAHVLKGLAPFERTSGMIVAYATQSGQTARDGNGRNSPFTAALLKELRTPRLEIGTFFRRVQADVVDATEGLQEPELSISLVPEYYINQEDSDETIWARIREDSNPAALRDFLARFPHSFFAKDAAVQLELLGRLERQKNERHDVALAPEAKSANGKPQPASVWSPLPAATPPDVAGSATSSMQDVDIRREVRQRLYELNFDPGAPDGPFTSAAQEAVRQFERKNNLPVTGIASIELLRRLRDAPTLKPWGAIVFDSVKGKWGLSWGADTRQAAVASARVSCGEKSGCPIEVSFFGGACGAFAHSTSSWSIDARADIAKATDAALADCRKQTAQCRIIASVCADGSHRAGGGE